MNCIELNRYISWRYNAEVIITGMADCHEKTPAAKAIGYVRKPVNYESYL